MDAREVGGTSLRAGKDSAWVPGHLTLDRTIHRLGNCYERRNSPIQYLLSRGTFKAGMIKEGVQNKD